MNSPLCCKSPRPDEKRNLKNEENNSCYVDGAVRCPGHVEMLFFDLDFSG
jgi:hypothetical protein